MMLIGEGGLFPEEKDEQKDGRISWAHLMKAA